MKIAIGPSSFAESDKAPLELLQAVGAEIVPNPFGRRLSEAEIIRQLADVDGLIAGLEPLNRTVLATATKLKALARVGIGMDNVDQQAAKELGIRVSNTPDEPTTAVAELTVTALLALNREIIASNEALHRGEWKKLIGGGLVGSNVLLIGYGRIGRRVADLVRAFGAQVLVCDPMLAQSDLTRGEKLVSLPEGLATADVISLHAAGKATILDAGALSRVKRGAILLNSARGELVDEAALCSALDEGVIRGVWCDVFRQEPYSGPLASYPQALLTPHVGTYTRECRRDMEVAAVRNLLRDLA